MQKFRWEVIGLRVTENEHKIKLLDNDHYRFIQRIFPLVTHVVLDIRTDFMDEEMWRRLANLIANTPQLRDASMNFDGFYDEDTDLQHIQSILNTLPECLLSLQWECCTWESCECGLFCLLCKLCRLQALILCFHRPQLPNSILSCLCQGGPICLLELLHLEINCPEVFAVDHIAPCILPQAMHWFSQLDAHIFTGPPICFPAITHVTFTSAIHLMPRIELCNYLLDILPVLQNITYEYDYIYSGDYSDLQAHWIHFGIPSTVRTITFSMAPGQWHNTKALVAHLELIPFNTTAQGVTVRLGSSDSYVRNAFIKFARRKGLLHKMTYEL